MPCSPRTLNLMVVCLLLLARTVLSVHLQNITITAPAGTTQHGHNNLLCVPARPWDIIVFFLANYASHALTTRSYPGEARLDFIWATVAAFLLPTSGMIRGFTALFRAGAFVKGFVTGDPLEIAARSGALCMVVRVKGWKPVPGTNLFQVAITSTDPARSAREPGFLSERRHQELNTVMHAAALLPHAFHTAVPTYHFNPQLVLDFGTFWSSRAADNRGRRITYIQPLGNIVRFEAGSFIEPDPSIARLWDDGYVHVPLDDVLNKHPSALPFRAACQTYVPSWVKDEAYGVFLPDTLTVTTGTRRIHRNPSLPEGYALAFVPRVARVVPLDDVDSHTVPTPQTSVLKGLITLGQAIYAFITVSAALKDQLAPYGYAAFGLTVLPYAVMSGLNLLGALLTPEFEELYLVQSDILLEARMLPGARFEGVVGRLLPKDIPPPAVPRLFENTLSATVEGQPSIGGQPIRVRVADSLFELIPGTPPPGAFTMEVPACSRFEEHVRTSLNYDRVVMDLITTITSPLLFPFNWIKEFTLAISSRQGSLLALAILVICTNMAIYGAIFFSHSGSGSETSVSQRVWIVLWLVTGTVFGVLASLGQFIIPSHRIGTTAKIVALCIAGVPAIGGFRVVAMMLLQYGTCIQY